jgi:hypothetical protein
METNELQKIWKNVDTEINQKSKEELNLLLASVTRQTINKFLFITSFGILSALGLLVFLTITSINRQDDLYYLMNNITLGIIAIVSLVSGLMSWYKLHNNEYNQSLKNWLEVRINHLSKLLTGKFNRLYIILIPFIYILTILSIHVYFENKPFIEVLHTEESISGLVAGTLIGLLVSYFAAYKTRRYELKNLEFLKDLYGRLCNIG